jgi:hypothetical protein
MDPSADGSTGWSSMNRHDESETHSRQPYQIATCIVFTVLSIFAVTLRLWVRKYMIKSLGTDDSMMVIALVGHYSISYYRC